MRKSILPFFIAAAALAACDPVSKSAAPTTADPAHSSRISVDWTGSYQGTLPCADCEGIATVITLRDDNSYEIGRKYIGKQDTVFYSAGKFEWNAEGSGIQLSNESPYFFQVGENQLVQFDMNGKKITGNLADNYVLRKIMPVITETYWKLIEIRGAPVPTGNIREPHIILHQQTGRMNGSNGCNNIMGSFELQEPGRIRFGQLAATRMACPDMETEQLLSKVLEAADNFNLVSDTLVLNKARMAPLARFVAVYLR